MSDQDITNGVPAPARRASRKGTPTKRVSRPAKPGRGNLDAILSSKWQHWTSPPKFLERLHKLGKPALDPCSNFDARTGALREWWGNHFEGIELEERIREMRDCNFHGIRHVELRNGLAESWSSQGLISYAYWNPPFNRLADWLKKGADERDQGVESVGLFPARTDTVAFHEQVFARANAGCFWRGRLNFDNPPPDSKQPGGTFPPFVAYYGRRIDEFFAAFDGAGELCRLNTPVYTEEIERGNG